MWACKNKKIFFWARKLFFCFKNDYDRDFNSIKMIVVSEAICDLFVICVCD